MKKHLFFAGALLMAGTMFATTPTFDGAKIYINPGHGGWNEANDRHIVTIPYGENMASDPSKIDTLGFWESSSNLKVGLFLRDMLEANGAEVMMSRTTNVSGVRDNDKQDYDYQIIGQGTKPAITDSLVGDRDLTQIAKEATEWEADAFISIHSNAASVGAACNYLVFFMPNGPEIQWGSTNWQFNSYRSQDDVEMAGVLWPRLLDNPLDVWTESKDPASPNIPTTGEYTLLKYGNLGVPGFICEASFHTYMPNTHRYLNPDYQYLEALRFYYAYCDYFDVELPATCCLCGDVRSAQYRATNATYLNYVSGSKDQWQPLNGATVTLKQGGATIDTYTVDNNWNGIYCFKSVTPGEYQLTFHYDTYTDTTITVTAVAGRTITTNILLNDPNYVAPIHEDLPDYEEWAIDQSFLGAFDVEKQTVATPDLSGQTILSVVFLNEKMYVLNTSNQIAVYDALTGAFVKNLSTNGVTEGSNRLLGSLATSADGKLIACNNSTLGFYGENGNFRIYMWEDDDDDPVVLCKCSKDAAEAAWTNGVVGNTFAFHGCTWHPYIYYPATTAAASKQIRVVGWEYSGDDEVFVAQKYMFDETSDATKLHYSESAWGTDYRFVTSPLHEHAFVVDGAGIVPMEYQFNWSVPSRTKLNELDTCHAVAATCTGSSFFKYAGRTFMVTDDASGAALIYDITNGLRNATSVASPIALEATGTPTFCATGAFMHEGELYVANYVQGVGYGLHRLIMKASATNLDKISAAEQPVKFLHNGHLMIRRNGRTFTATGARR